MWGGNLSVLVSLLGTPYFPEIKGGILFLEDVGEHPYRIERMLTQLLHAGVLARQKAIVLGQFTEFKLVPHDRGYKLQTVVNWLRQPFFREFMFAAAMSAWGCVALLSCALKWEKAER